MKEEKKRDVHNFMDDDFEDIHYKDIGQDDGPDWDWRDDYEIMELFKEKGETGEPIKVTVVDGEVVLDEVDDKKFTDNTIFTTIQETIHSITHDEVKFLNQSLLHGRGKTSSGEASHSPIWEYYNKSIASTSNINLVNMYFFRFNSTQISEATDNGYYNCYLPRSLGGCGFIGRPKRLTNYQLALASHLYRRHTRAGDVMEQDLGLVSYTKSFGTVGFDPYKNFKGIRTKAYDVPKEGWKLKPRTINSRAINSGTNDDVLIERRFPIILPKQTKFVKDTEKLYNFGDILSTHILLPQQSNRHRPIQHCDMSNYSDDLCEVTPT